MKVSFRTLVGGFFLLLGLTLMPGTLKADDPNPPDPGGNPTGGGGGGPVGAPIDGGLGILVILAGSAGYGSYKLYKARSKDSEEEMGEAEA